MTAFLPCQLEIRQRKLLHLFTDFICLYQQNARLRKFKRTKNTTCSQNQQGQQVSFQCRDFSATQATTYSLKPSQLAATFHAIGCVTMRPIFLKLYFKDAQNEMSLYQSSNAGPTCGSSLHKTKKDSLSGHVSQWQIWRRGKQGANLCQQGETLRCSASESTTTECMQEDTTQADTAPEPSQHADIYSGVQVQTLCICLLAASEQNPNKPKQNHQLLIRKTLSTINSGGRRLGGNRFHSLQTPYSLSCKVPCIGSGCKQSTQYFRSVRLK